MSLPKAGDPLTSESTQSSMVVVSGRPHVCCSHVRPQHMEQENKHHSMPGDKSTHNMLSEPQPAIHCVGAAGHCSNTVAPSLAVSNKSGSHSGTDTNHYGDGRAERRDSGAASKLMSTACVAHTRSW